MPACQNAYTSRIIKKDADTLRREAQFCLS